MALAAASLYALLRAQRDHKLPPRAALRVVQQLSSAVSFVHGKTILHGDLHLGNVLVLDTGVLNEINTKLADFGSAELLESLEGLAEKYPATVRPPELWFAQGAHVVEQATKYNYMRPTVPVRYSTPADVWALGCIVVQVSTREVVFPDVPGPSAGDWAFRQIVALVRLCGTPSRSLIGSLKWDGFFGNRCPAEVQSRSAIDKRGVWSCIPCLDNVLRQVFLYDASRRVTAAQLEDVAAKELACSTPT